jgi:single-stranded DNA-binding protein
LITGILGRDPEVRELGGKPIASVSVALSFKAYGEIQNQKANQNGYVTTWAKLKAVGEDAVGTLTNFTKGNKVVLSDVVYGEEDYVDKDGNARNQMVFTFFDADGVRPADMPAGTNHPSREPATAGKPVKNWGQAK